MWIREVDFPTALIEAHRSGNLVLFVGAGASIDPPSALPTFNRLTLDIAEAAGVEAQPADLDKLDVFLGQIEDRDVDVHWMVATRIGVSTSEPNRLHRALADLAAAGAPLRIVTTNYDVHLSRALQDRGAAVAEYIGPALPMGDDFAGVVYLHGSLRQHDPRHLVVTDADFGRAYLRDAWAARFLERMFATYTVLFVGYRHGDIVMQYLARALGPRTNRFILTHDPDAPDWSRYGLHPVGYKVVDESHEKLVEALERWAGQASMGLLDHRQRIAQLVSLPPSHTPEEESYLESALTDEIQARIFSEHARSDEWLLWAVTRPEVRQLFETAAQPTDLSWSLATWFAKHVVADEQLSGTALSVVRDRDGRFGPVLWSAIGHQLHMRGAPRPRWLAPWIVLLIQNAPPGRTMRSDWLELALEASRWPDDRAEALLLFEHLTEPFAVPQTSFGRADVRFEPELKGSAHGLDEVWHNLFVPNLQEAAPEVLAIADRNLRRAAHLLTAANPAQSGWDPISFRRSAIEPHSQDRYREPIDALIDAARDCSEALLEIGAGHAMAYIDSWAASDVTILRRLALHAWSNRTDVDNSAKLTWLRQQDWLFVPELRHEVFRLIEGAIADAGQEVADALVTDIIAGPGVETADTEHRAYQQFNALAWVTRHAPSLESAQTALVQLHSQHPYFEERERPDLLYTTEVGVVPHRPPMTIDELHDRLTADPDHAVRELRTYEQAWSPLDRAPIWSDAARVLQETVRDHPSDGFAVLDAPSTNSDILNAVVAGWASASIDDATAERVLQRLMNVDLESAADSIARLLSDSGDTNPTKWHLLPTAQLLAARLWSALDEAPATTEVEDWLMLAINRPAGRLAQFWLQAIAADWKAAGEAWSGLPPTTRTELERILDGVDGQTDLAQVVLASQVFFFFGADREWCESHVLPLLGWDHSDRARRTWDGYLSWGRWNDHLLSAGLLPQYLAAARHIQDIRLELQRQLCAHLAGIAVSSELEPISWMRDFTATVEVEHRVEWMNQVAWMFDDLPPNVIEHQWQRWMQSYWEGRLDSVPRQLAPAEASAMAAWVVHLTESIDAGVNLATSTEASLNEHADALHSLTDDRLGHAPRQFARLIAHLLSFTQPPFYGGYELQRIVPQLHDGADPTDLNTIKQEAVRLGLGDIGT